MANAAGGGGGGSGRKKNYSHQPMQIILNHRKINGGAAGGKE